MSSETEIRKEVMSSHGEDITDSTRDGESYILTKKMLSQPRDSIKTVDYSETDHSTSNQDYQERESSPSEATTTSVSTR